VYQVRQISSQRFLALMLFPAASNNTGIANPKVTVRSFSVCANSMTDDWSTSGIQGSGSRTGPHFRCKGNGQSLFVYTHTLLLMVHLLQTSKAPMSKPNTALVPKVTMVRPLSMHTSLLTDDCLAPDVSGFWFKATSCDLH
jgi:hypothetical protein